MAGMVIQWVFIVLTTVCPLGVYWIIEKDVRTLTIVVNKNVASGNAGANGNKNDNHTVTLLGFDIDAKVSDALGILSDTDDNGTGNGKYGHIHSGDNSTNIIFSKTTTTEEIDTVTIVDTKNNKGNNDNTDNNDINNDDIGTEDVKTDHDDNHNNESIHFHQMLKTSNDSSNNNGDNDDNVDFGRSETLESENNDFIDAMKDVYGSKTSERYAFLLTNDYDVFTPSKFVRSNTDTPRVGAMSPVISRTRGDTGGSVNSNSNVGPNMDVIELFQHTQSQKFESKLWRVGFAVLIPLVLLTLVVFSDFSMILICGVGLLILFIGYFSHLTYLFIKAATQNTRGLFRMYSLSSQVPGWTSMSVSYRVLAFKKHPIESISEFSAIDGGIAQTMLLAISCYTWTIVLCAVGFEIHEKLRDGNSKTKVNFADYAEIIGSFGLVLIGTFELDPFAPFSQAIHYIGTFCGLVLIGTFELDPFAPFSQAIHYIGTFCGFFTIIGFVYQQCLMAIHSNNYVRLILPIVILVIAIVAWFFWLYFGYVAQLYPPRTKTGKPNIIQLYAAHWNEPLKLDDATITKISLQNVISEAVFLVCGALSLCLWMMFYNQCHSLNQCLPP